MYAYADGLLAQTPTLTISQLNTALDAWLIADVRVKWLKEASDLRATLFTGGNPVHNALVGNAHEYVFGRSSGGFGDNVAAWLQHYRCAWTAFNMTTSFLVGVFSHLLGRTSMPSPYDTFTACMFQWHKRYLYYDARNMLTSACEAVMPQVFTDTNIADAVGAVYQSIRQTTDVLYAYRNFEDEQFPQDNAREHRRAEMCCKHLEDWYHCAAEEHLKAKIREINVRPFIDVFPELSSLVYRITEKAVVNANAGGDLHYRFAKECTTRLTTMPAVHVYGDGGTSVCKILRYVYTHRRRDRAENSKLETATNTVVNILATRACAADVPMAARLQCAQSLRSCLEFIPCGTARTQIHDSVRWCDSLPAPVLARELHSALKQRNTPAANAVIATVGLTSVGLGTADTELFMNVFRPLTQLRLLRAQDDALVAERTAADDLRNAVGLADSAWYDELIDDILDPGVRALGRQCTVLRHTQVNANIKGCVPTCEYVQILEKQLPEMAQDVQMFDAMYCAQYDRRRLVWAPYLATVDVQCLHLSGAPTVVVSPIQAAILLQLNDSASPLLGNQGTDAALAGLAHVGLIVKRADGSWQANDNNTKLVKPRTFVKTRRDTRSKVVGAADSTGEHHYKLQAEMTRLAKRERRVQRAALEALTTQPGAAARAIAALVDKDYLRQLSADVFEYVP